MTEKQKNSLILALAFMDWEAISYYIDRCDILWDAEIGGVFDQIKPNKWDVIDRTISLAYAHLDAYKKKNVPSDMYFSTQSGNIYVSHDHKENSWDIKFLVAETNSEKAKHYLNDMYDEFEDEGGLDPYDENADYMTPNDYTKFYGVIEERLNALLELLNNLTINPNHN